MASVMKSTSARSFYTWVNNIFNKVNRQRVREAGADRAAAEFVMIQMNGKIAVETGNAVSPLRWITSESELPADVKLKAIDLDESAISDVGMEYLLGLNHLTVLGLRNCKYVQTSGLQFMAQLPLKALDLSGCSITENGLDQLTGIRSLQRLDIYGMPKLSAEAITSFTGKAMPRCSVITQPPQVPLLKSDLKKYL